MSQKKRNNFRDSITIDIFDVENYIQEQIEDIIRILGLQVSFCVKRKQAIELIKKQVGKF